MHESPPEARVAQRSHRRWGVRNLPSLLSSLDSPGDALSFVGPNWFASIMGTGIVANAAATLPFLAHRLHDFALVVWIIAALMLLVVSVAVGAHWIRHPQVARSHARNPNMAQFYGAPPMALMTVGGGALLAGKST